MVLVCHPHKFIFLKTHKTAGTSVEMLLEKFCRPPGYDVTEDMDASITKFGIVGSRGPLQNGFLPFLPDRKLSRNKLWRNHMTAERVRKRLGAKKWTAYRKISTVRNPYDRMVSMFHWRNQKNADFPTEFKLIRDAFRQFILKRDWVDDAGVVAINGEYILDFAIRFEQLRPDLLTLKQQFGIPLDPGDLPHTKNLGTSRKGRNTAEYYDPDTLDLVRNALAWVFERFGYPDKPLAGENAA